MIWPLSDIKDVCSHLTVYKKRTEIINAMLVGISTLLKLFWERNTHYNMAWDWTVLSLTGSAGPQKSRKTLGASVAWISRAMQGPEQSSSTIFCNTSSQELTIPLVYLQCLYQWKSLLFEQTLGRHWSSWRTQVTSVPLNKYIN